MATAPKEVAAEPRSRQFYRAVMTAMNEAGIHFLVGGTHAFARYTGLRRHTKDFDLFLTRAETERAMKVLGDAGFETELKFPHWLAKVHDEQHFVDLIFGAGNGVAMGDDLWYEYAVPGEVLGIPVKLCPAEEMIWSKAFIMERERFDGADVAHLIQSCAARLDWKRLLKRFRPYPRVLLVHLILFGFVFPHERNQIPRWVMDKLIQRLQYELDIEPPAEKVCYGTILSRGQYLFDIGRGGCQDARLLPPGPMSAEDVAYWTSRIGE